MEPILTVRGMDKSFGATVALRQVDLDVYPGEIRGLIGENGSGKSTLTSIIAGIQKADAGQMEFHGKPWQPASMIDALEHGIGMIVQETGTIPGITVAENLFLGESGRFRNRLGLVSRRAMEAESRKALDVIHADHINPGMPAGMLDLQERKLVEVARVMVKKPEILVVDETTTALSQKGRELLYRLMDSLKKEEIFNLDLKEVLFRLFHEHQVRVSKEQEYAFGCRCSREKLQQTLSSMKSEDIEDMVENGKITATCNFCGQVYTFDKGELLKH